MKVLIILDSLVEAGAEKSMVEIALHFHKYSPVFVYLYQENTLHKELEAAGVKVYALTITSKYGYKTALKKIIPIYREEQPDIIHSALYRADAVARKLKKRFPDIPLVGSFVNNSYTPLRYQNKSLIMKAKLWLAYRLDKSSAKKVDLFISNSETIKKSEGGALGVPENKIKVIYRGRDLKKFSKVDHQEIVELKKELNLEDKNVLINVSRLIKRKAQSDIIRALPAVLEKFPDTVLLIIGNGEEEEALKQEIQQLELFEKAVLLGRKRNIPQYLALSDIFVYPSYAEGLPGALIEAMMAEKIIIASDIKENLECVNKESALIFEKGNVAHISNKIIDALENIENYRYLAMEAKRQAIKKFEINNIAQKYEETYDNLIEKDDPR